MMPTRLVPPATRPFPKRTFRSAKMLTVRGANRRFGRSFPKGTLIVDTTLPLPVPLIDAIEDRSATLGVSRTKLIYDVLTLWMQAVRDYELEYELPPLEEHERLAIVSPYDGYTERLALFGAPSALDVGLESL